MKRLVLALFIAGCTTTGNVDPNLGDRIAADVNCLAQLSLDGIQIYSAWATPSSRDVAVALSQTAELSAPTFAACRQTLNNAGADVSALKAKVKN